MNRFYKAALILFVALISIDQPLLYSFNFETVKSSVINYFKPVCTQEKIVKTVLAGALIGITVFGIYSYLKYRSNKLIRDLNNKNSDSKESKNDDGNSSDLERVIKNGEKEENDDFKDDSSEGVINGEKEEDDSFENVSTDSESLSQLEREVLELISEVEDLIRDQAKIIDRIITKIVKLENKLELFFDINNDSNLTIKLTHFQKNMESLRLSLKRYNGESEDNFIFDPKNAEKITNSCQNLTKLLTQD
jgi:vacuolar-type H+-ATPase subunit I/STV1